MNDHRQKINRKSMQSECESNETPAGEGGAYRKATQIQFTYNTNNNVKKYMYISHYMVKLSELTLLKSTGPRGHTECRTSSFT